MEIHRFPETVEKEEFVLCGHPVAPGSVNNVFPFGHGMPPDLQIVGEVLGGEPVNPGVTTDTIRRSFFMGVCFLGSWFLLLIRFQVI